MSDAAPAKAEAAPKKKGGLPTILLIGNAVLMLAVLGAVVFMMLKKPSAPAAAEAPSKGEAKGHGEAKAEGGHGEAKAEGGKGESKGEGGHGEAKGEGGKGESKGEGGHGGGGGGSGGGHGGGGGGGGGDSGGGSRAGGLGPTIKMTDFVVHLRNPEADRYARFAFDIEVGSDKDKELLTARSAQIRDAFITFLSDRTVEDLRGSAGLERLKGALLDKLQEIARDAHPRQIYVTDFVLQ